MVLGRRDGVRVAFLHMLGMLYLFILFQCRPCCRFSATAAVVQSQSPHSLTHSLRTRSKTHTVYDPKKIRFSDLSTAHKIRTLQHEAAPACASSTDSDLWSCMDTRDSRYFGGLKIRCAEAGQCYSSTQLCTLDGQVTAFAYLIAGGAYRLTFVALSQYTLTLILDGTLVSTKKKLSILCFEKIRNKHREKQNYESLWMVRQKSIVSLN